MIKNNNMIFFSLKKSYQRKDKRKREYSTHMPQEQKQQQQMPQTDTVITYSDHEYS